MKFDCFYSQILLNTATMYTVIATYVNKYTKQVDTYY